MALVNFSMYVMLIMYQLTAVYSEETSSESTDIGINEKLESETEGVRCYCNTAQCVITGYMCRSTSSGGCYSEFSPAPKRPHHSRHGCINHLADSTEEALKRCQNSPTGGPPPPAWDHSLLICCFRDMCNHEDSPLGLRHINITNLDLESTGVASEKGATYNSEVWFKAATIAVPVCGALILFILVVVAIRLLKADALLHADRKLRGSYMTPLAQHSSDDVKKVWIGTQSSPLLVTPGGCLVAVERAQLIDQPCDKLLR